MASNPNRIQPMDEPRSGKGKLAGLIGGTAAVSLLALVGSWEGKANDPYADLIGKMTVCYGETNVEMRHYSDAECRDMLDSSLAQYAAPVLAINPELRGYDAQTVAATSLAYNIGITNYRRSTVSRKFRAGQWRAACSAMLSWSYAGGRQVKGLLNRRKAEQAVCLRGL